MKEEKVKIVILGAGVAGLSAAYYLSKTGYEVHLIEKEAEVGGLCRTFKKDGFCFDLGGHRFITTDEEVLREVKSLLSSELLITKRKSTIKFQGKDFEYPLSVRDLFSLNWSLKLKFIVDYFKECLPYGNREENTLERWLIKRFGETLYNVFFQEYSTKLWGREPAFISADWAYQRISTIDLGDVILRLFSFKRDFAKTYADNFYYPQYGIGMIADKFREAIEDNNGRIYCNSLVTEIAVRDKEVSEVVFRNQENEAVKISGKLIVLSTIPINNLVNILKSKEALGEIRRLAQSLHFRSLKTVNLLINRDKVTDNNWMYIPDKEYVFFRIQEPKNWSRALAPSGKTSLVLEIACSKGDEIWNTQDESIVSKSVEDLSRLGFNLKGDIIDSFVLKEENAYPIYHLGYKGVVEKIIKELFKINNLLSFGRQGLFRYNNMDHSIKMGMIAAEHVRAGIPKEKILVE